MQTKTEVRVTIVFHFLKTTLDLHHIGMVKILYMLYQGPVYTSCTAFCFQFLMLRKLKLIQSREKSFKSL